jgi:hypothetical protein
VDTPNSISRVTNLGICSISNYMLFSAHLRFFFFLYKKAKNLIHCQGKAATAQKPPKNAINRKNSADSELNTSSKERLFEPLRHTLERNLFASSSYLHFMFMVVTYTPRQKLKKN